MSTTQGVNVLRPQVSWPALSGSFYVLHIQLKRLPSILTTQTVHVMVCFVFVFCFCCCSKVSTITSRKNESDLKAYL